MLLAQAGIVGIGPALLIGLVVCVGIGLVNGLIVTKVGISSFLVTLSMLLIVRGVALYATQGFPLKVLGPARPIRDAAGRLLRTRPVPPLHLAVVVHRPRRCWPPTCSTIAKVGNWISAIGSNRNAAVARGVPADGVKIGLLRAHLRAGGACRHDQRVPHLGRLSRWRARATNSRSSPWW